MFDLEMFKKLCNGKDFIFSPYSIKNTFSYLFPLSIGRGREELEKVLDFNIRDNVYYSDYNKDIECDSNLNIVNRVFVNKEMDINNSLLESLDFEFIDMNSKTAKYINNFIAENTNHKILNLLMDNSISKDTLFLLMNAIYFNKKWNFTPNMVLWCGNEMREGFRGDMEIRNVKEYEDIDILRIPYSIENDEHQYSMYIFCDSINSKENHAVEFVKKLDSDTFNKLLNFKDYTGLSNYDEVSFSIPCFELNFNDSLVKNLRLLGLIDVFESDSKSFSQLADDAFISDVIHGAYIKTDAFGTEATSATVISMIKNCCFNPKPNKFVCADSPFVFVIKDDTADEILFMGSVCE